MKFIILLATILCSLNSHGQNARGSYVVSRAPLRHHSMADVQRVAANNPRFASEFTSAFRLGFRPMMRNWGSAEFQPLAILVQNDRVNTRAVREFRLALINHKRNLMRLYNLRNDTYNKLAAMALGIFGNESEFGSSLRYNLKERNQDLVIALKYLSGDSSPTPSRGGTQIKEIPEKIAEEYPEITSDSLILPTNAAIATVGFLTETFSMLLQRSRNDRMNAPSGRASLTYIQPENVFDYIPYVYSGQMRKLFNGPRASNGATVTDNLYINNMKRNMGNFYFMSKQENED